ncbi:hypothetical protein BGX27_001981 [Mortierella sp. AM989]|nr:hypothetical protein BGX27_001981 [Mortierella sp. AM989]
MAASLDTTASAQQLQHLQHHAFTRDSQRNKRSFSNPVLALASLRSSFSQVSLRDDQQSQRKSQSTTASPSTTPISTRSGRSHDVDSGIDLQGVPATINSRSGDNSKSTSNGVNLDSKLPLPQLQIPYNKGRVTKNNKHAEDRGHTDNSYFSDILDKYCNSDEDPTSPSTASPTSPFSTGHGWVDFKSAQPPTPPVTSNRYSQNPSNSRATPLRNSSTILPNASPNTTTSPMLAASAKFNAYLQSTSNRSSHDSPPLCGSTFNSSDQLSPSLGQRTYTKRPVPTPGSVSASPRAQAVSATLSQNRPGPPPKDSHRQISNAQFNNNSNSQLPLQQQSTFTAVVDEATRRNRTTSVSSFSSSSSGSINPYAESVKTTTRERSSSSLLSYLSNTPQDQSSQQQLYKQGSTSPRSPGNEEKSYYQQQQQHWLQQQQHQQQQQYQQRHDQRQWATGSPHHHAQQTSHNQLQSPSHGSAPLTPSEMLSRRFDMGARSLSQGSVTSVSKYSATLHGVKSALARTPIVRARANDVNGSRKVNFGDVITIVTVQRAESPPPPPVDVKKSKKKAKKGSKTGPHPDPEYNAEYYNTPYTPEPAEVLVTQAPWIGNPNYDEEKQNSRFYYDDGYDCEEDDHEYEATRNIRQGPEDDEDEDEDDEDDEFGTGSRTWGNGIAGGTSSPKKKGGIFKFKRAVNRLLRN